MIETVQDVPPIAAADEAVSRHAARSNSLDGMAYLWRGGPRKPLRIGVHTRAIHASFTRAVNRYIAGMSTYIDLRIPLRHGKSESVAYAMAWLQGKLFHLHPEVISMGATESLALNFSRMTLSIMAEPQYQSLFPGIYLNPKRSAAEDWSLAGSRGGYRAAGMGGSVVGRNAGVLVIDDWCPSRKDAERQLFRDSIWTCFTNDLMYRRLEPSIVLIVSTPWHIDGMQHRIEARMKSEPDFPQFEKIQYRARWTNPATGQYEYLFPEKYSPGWINAAYAGALPYEVAGLWDCDPIAAAGTVGSRNWFRKVPKVAIDGRAVRYWDTAATKQKSSDFTCGVRGGKSAGRFSIADILKVRVPAAEVGDLMLGTARADGFGTEVWIECEKGSMGLVGPAELAKPMVAAGYTVRLAKRGHGSKLCTWIEFFQEAKRQSGIESLSGLAVAEGPCVETFLTAIDAAPDSPNDDDIDAASGAYKADAGLVESETAVGGGARMVVI